MRRFLFSLILVALACDAGAATYNVDPTTWPTIQPTVTSSDTVNFTGTLAGPVTVSTGTLNNMAVTSASTDTNTGSLRINGSVTLNYANISNSSAGSGRTAYISTGANVINYSKFSSSGNANTSVVITGGDKTTLNSLYLYAPKVAGLSHEAVSISISGSAINSSFCVIGTGYQNIKNNSFLYTSRAISIVNGEYANNIFYSDSAPTTGASVTFNTYSAWNGDVSTWGAGCVSLTGSPWIVPSPVNPWDFRLNWGPWANGGVSIAGVTDRLDLLGLSYRNEAPSMGAVQYWGQGSDEDFTTP